nr:PREDICTED: neuropeptide Y receptor-like isoform X1 [Bemisia tabaci]XP_018911136.1 PREDICTED: neuropeptide Y receptor-like isoform X1 [Bemisia tabaci]
MNISELGLYLWNASSNGSAADGYLPSLEVLEPEFQVALILIYSLTATLSLTGNLTVVMILGFGKRSSGDLRLFLINLAVSDVTMAIFSIPFTYTMFLLGRWVFTPWFCPIVLGMQHVSVFVSVYTLTAIGIDRYKAIVTPFNRRINKNQSKYVMAGIWVGAFALSSVQLYVSSAREFVFYNGETYYECTEWWDSETSSQLYTVFIFTLTFFVPLMGLAYTYSAIAWSLWWRVSPGNAYHHRDKAQTKSKMKVIKMLVTIVILFALCWLPLQLFLLLYYFYPEISAYRTESEKRVYALSYFLCHWLANANSFVNPLVYCFMSDNFRADLKELLCRRMRRRTQRLSARSPTATRVTMCPMLTTTVHNGESSDNVLKKSLFLPCLCKARSSSSTVKWSTSVEDRL